MSAYFCKCTNDCVSIDDEVSFLHLFFRFLSVSKGFDFLSKLIFIDSEFKAWQEKGNLLFVTQMELFLEELFLSNSFLNSGKSKFM
jgi:hypothetical protein